MHCTRFPHVEDQPTNDNLTGTADTLPQGDVRVANSSRFQFSAEPQTRLFKG